jgi:hypothetical protein
VEEELRAQRGLTIGVMVAAALLGTLLVAGGPAGTSPRSAVVAVADTLVTTTTVAPGPASTAVTTTTPAPTTTTAPAPSTSASPTTDPGALPQTDARPSASGATFTAGVDALWEAIRQDQPDLGLPFFFPKSAYLQVKAISDPAGDYQNRLIANFDQDVHAVHAQLGADAADAKLVGINVPDAQAVWVQPGEESNKLSYWRVYGTTLQYQVDGRSGSIPVTSLISWRGEWYVVHLGAIR